MGQIYSSYQHYTFKELQNKLENKKSEFILLNTLPIQEQNYLIKGTINATLENDFINGLVKKDKNKEIIIYGRDHHDMKVIEKYNKLKKIGFTNVYIYFGGLFEWSLLQEIYGQSNFQTDGNVSDPLTII
jgi:hypothetical protein